ncbi:MAG: hypothetical protein GEU26_09060 [Nitrososphaeraceae archaeon]|nr:hypothetical protein [Nitrososphaeraceae archaeon]
MTNDYIGDLKFRYQLTVEAISNFDSYAWVAVGLFVLGIIGVLIYEKSDARQNSAKNSGKASDIGS